MTSKVFHFPNIGVIRGVLTETELAPIKQEISDIQSDFTKATPANYGLAGNIKKEFFLLKSKSYIEQLMFPYAQQFISEFKYENKISNANMYMNKKITDHGIAVDTVWVNFQEKYEFNPNHDHFGFLSFVIWTKVPYTVESEKKVSPGNSSNTQNSGEFQFSYTDILGTIQLCSLSMSPEVENNFMIFPSALKHCVYPFYSSNEYRISVAGNYKLV